MVTLLFKESHVSETPDQTHRVTRQTAQETGSKERKTKKSQQKTLLDIWNVPTISNSNPLQSKSTGNSSNQVSTISSDVQTPSIKTRQSRRSLENTPQTQLDALSFDSIGEIEKRMRKREREVDNVGNEHHTQRGTRSQTVKMTENPIVNQTPTTPRFKSLQESSQSPLFTDKSSSKPNISASKGGKSSRGLVESSRVRNVANLTSDAAPSPQIIQKKSKLSSTTRKSQSWLDCALASVDDIDDFQISPKPNSVRTRSKRLSGESNETDENKNSPISTENHVTHDTLSSRTQKVKTENEARQKRKRLSTDSIEVKVDESEKDKSAEERKSTRKRKKTRRYSEGMAHFYINNK